MEKKEIEKISNSHLGVIAEAESLDPREFPSSVPDRELYTPMFMGQFTMDEKELSHQNNGIVGGKEIHLREDLVFISQCFENVEMIDDKFKKKKYCSL